MYLRCLKFDADILITKVSNNNYFKRDLGALSNLQSLCCCIGLTEAVKSECSHFLSIAQCLQPGFSFLSGLLWLIKGQEMWIMMLNWLHLNKVIFHECQVESCFL